jgi:hypothetical protein
VNLNMTTANEWELRQFWLVLCWLWLHSSTNVTSGRYWRVARLPSSRANNNCRHLLTALRSPNLLAPNTLADSSKFNPVFRTPTKFTTLHVSACNVHTDNWTLFPAVVSGSTLFTSCCHGNSWAISKLSVFDGLHLVICFRLNYKTLLCTRLISVLTCAHTLLVLKCSLLAHWTPVCYWAASPQTVHRTLDKLRWLVIFIVFRTSVDFTDAIVIYCRPSAVWAS